MRVGVVWYKGSFAGCMNAHVGLPGAMTVSRKRGAYGNVMFSNESTHACVYSICMPEVCDESP